MKGFVAGLVCGIAVYAAGNAWWTRERAALQNFKSVANASQHQGTGAAGESPSSKPMASTTIVTQRELPRDGECIFVDDKNLEQVSWMLIKRQGELAKANLDAEPKDPLWAAETEQQLREFIARHPLGNQFNLTKLDCRTLYCEVKAECPLGGDALDAFSNVMGDLAESMNLHVGSSGSGNMVGQGLVEAHSRLRRYKIGDTCPPGFQNDCWNR